MRVDDRREIESTCGSPEAYYKHLEGLQQKWPERLVLLPSWSRLKASSRWSPSLTSAAAGRKTSSTMASRPPSGNGATTS
jgi:hypothetical protein